MSEQAVIFWLSYDYPVLKPYWLSYNQSPSFHTFICISTYICTGCPGGNVPELGRMFLKFKYYDITKNTYIRSWTVTEIKVWEKCGLLAVPRTVPGSRDVLPVGYTCPSLSTAGSSALHAAAAYVKRLEP